MRLWFGSISNKNDSISNSLLIVGQRLNIDHIRESVRESVERAEID